MNAQRSAVIAALAWVLTQTAYAGTMVSQPFEGVTRYHQTLAQPRPLNVNVLVIDPQAAGIRFAVSPGNGDEPREFNRQTSLEFAKQIGAQIAINAGFFFPWPNPSKEVDVKGLAACEGKIVSPQEDDIVRPVLNITADNRICIIDSDTVKAGELYNAVSGNERLLVAGQNHGGEHPYNDPQHRNPRSAAGLTADGKLVLITIDGRQDGFSEGVLNHETADLLLEYGVTDALNLDGGGSTTMVIADPVLRVLNHPPGGRLRAVANSLAVFAKPTDEPRDDYIYCDFYSGDLGALAYYIHHCAKSSLGEVFRDGNRWIGRLTVIEDPAQTDWQAGCLCLKNHPANPLRPLSGKVSVSVRTWTVGQTAAIVLQIGDSVKHLARQAIPGDGQWHTLTWLVDEVAGETTFQLLGLSFFGSDRAVIDVDDLMHEAE